MPKDCIAVGRENFSLVTACHRARARIVCLICVAVVCACGHLFVLTRVELDVPPPAAVSCRPVQPVRPLRRRLMAWRCHHHLHVLHNSSSYRGGCLREPVAPRV